MSGHFESLVSRAQKGDKDAFAEIYEQYLNKIYRFVYYLGEEKELAEDITQETFLKAWRSLPTFSSAKGTIQAFLYKIARNLVIDYQRRRKALPLETAEDIPGKESPEEDVERKEKEEMVKKALALLDGFDRQILILHYFEELPSAEIAEIVGKKDGAVRVAIHRALGKAKEILETI